MKEEIKKACLFVHDVYQKNEIFNTTSPLNRDGCLDFFHELKKQFLEVKIDLQTQDMCSLDEAVFIIYNEIPKNLSSVKNSKNSVVLLFESELIRPENWNLKNHEYFKYIFTWNDNFIDNKKYFKFNFTHSSGTSFKKFSEKNKFCTLIAGNKAVRHPLELYSKRIEIIRWFEKFHPEQFEFYGMGWNSYTFNWPIFSKILNRIKPLTKLLAKEWPLYRGPIKDKMLIMRDFKFSICYENAYGIPGYITEKIFDSMSAGCIPVYWGAPNITNFVPKECFVNRVDFSSNEELYEYLNNMSEAEYNSKLRSIEKYLASAQHKLFEPIFNAQIIVEKLARV